MKNLIKIALLFITSAVFAQETTFTPYIGLTTYEDLSKDNSLEAGLYTSANYKKNTFLLGYRFKTINYVSTSTLDMTKQHDITFAYSYKATSNIELRGTFHYILSNLLQSDKTLVSLIGAQGNYEKILFGLNISVSKYNDLALTNFTHQLTPYFGFYFGDNDSMIGTIYTKLSYDAIYPNGANQTLAEEYTSYSIRITQYTGKFENTFKYWLGERLYGVTNNGLDVSNLNDVYSGGLSISSKFKFTKNKAVEFSYNNEDYTTFGSTTKSNLNQFLLSANFTF